MRIKIEDLYEEVDFSKIIQDCDSENFKDDIFINASFEEVKHDIYDDCQLKYQKTLTSNEKGRITVIAKLDNTNRTLISSAKINLYVLNGISPKLVESKLTDNKGQVIFNQLDAGSYRVIAIVDKKHFEKPTYTPWNEVNIDNNNLEATVEVINKIKIN